MKSGKLLALPIVEPVFRRKVCLAVKHDQADSYLLEQVKQVKQVIESVVAELVGERNWPGTLTSPVTSATLPLKSNNSVAPFVLFIVSSFIDKLPTQTQPVPNG